MSSLESLFSSEIIRAFGWTLLHSLWQGAVIFLLALVLIMVLRKQGPKTRYAALCSLFLLIPALFSATFFMIYEPGKTVASEVVPVLSNEMAYQSDLLNRSAGDITWYSSIFDFLDQNTHWLVLTWFIGFIILLVRFSGSLLYLYRLRNTNLKAVPGEWKSLLNGLSGRMGIRKAVNLAESALVKVPVTAGYLKPVILLPLGTIAGVPPQMIEAILLHELAHIRRKDYLINIIQSVIEIIFFYHPVTWWLSEHIREEREHICDDIALSVSNDRINYIKALTTMEENNVQSVTLVPAMTGSRKKLLQRITRLAYPEKIRKGFMEGIVACLMLAGIALGISANAITASSDSVSGLYLDLPAEPDTIIAKSASGKVTITVYTDTIEEGDQDVINDMVESIDESVSDTKGDKKVVEKKVIVMKSMPDEVDHADSVSQVIVISDGDSVRVISSTVEVITGEPGDFSWESIPPVPDMPDMDEFNVYAAPGGQVVRGNTIMVSITILLIRLLLSPSPEHFEFYIDEEGVAKSAQEYEQAVREYEFQYRDMEDQQREMERQMRHEQRYIIAPGEPVAPLEWYSYDSPMQAMSTEKIIRQELREEGLVEPGKSYIVEISSKAMYINGEKQSKEVAKKFQHLVEGLDSGVLDENGTFKLVF